MLFYSPIAPIALWNLIWSDWWWSPKHPCKIQYLNFCDWATSYSDTLTIDLWHTDLNKWVSRCLFQTLNEKVINNNDECNNSEPLLELNYILTVLIGNLSISCPLCTCCLLYSLSYLEPTKVLISFMLLCRSVELFMNLSHLLGSHLSLGCREIVWLFLDHIWIQVWTWGHFHCQMLLADLQHEGTNSTGELI